MTLDTVWFIVLPDNEGVIYAKPGLSSDEAWKNAIKAAKITGWNKTYLEKMGYRARKVKIIFE